MKNIKTLRKFTIRLFKFLNNVNSMVNQLNSIRFINVSKPALVLMLCALVSGNATGQCGQGQNILQNVGVSKLKANTSFSSGNSFIAPCDGKIESISFWLDDINQAGTAALSLHLGDSENDEIAYKELNIGTAPFSRRINAVFFIFL